ncbi:MULTISPECIES: hypothetical protein [unclassified Janthinobacterium]|uniref:hypothetical protein n=1 Tax=unclassified Janthinobacterium TaxID=2610881 RepID=UPI0018C9C69E|nr:hypothetical protein [Janthinobacterium sp. CG_23.4]MDH6159617.1 hypothetical protein [Janthinobacterium sp. CG_23.4]
MISARSSQFAPFGLKLADGRELAPGTLHPSLALALAWDRIKLINIICTYTELTLLLEASQTGAAYSVLSKIVAQ